MPEWYETARDAAQLFLGAATLGYLVTRVSSRMAVTEFKVDQLWRWYIQDKRQKNPPGEAHADRE